MRRAAAIASVLLAAACSADNVTRRDVVDGYRRELVRQGVVEAQARCLTDLFFVELTDAQLREFQKRDALTDAERQRFAQLGEQCASAT